MQEKWVLAPARAGWRRRELSPIGVDAEYGHADNASVPHDAHDQVA